MSTANARRPGSLPVIYPAALLLVAMWVSRAAHPEDLDTFLLPWFSHIVAQGPVEAFATPFSNYNPPYLYLLALASPAAAWTSAAFAIKSVSYAGHAALGVAILHLLRAMGVDRPARGAMMAMVAPTLLANAAVLVQCDALWAAAIVMAVAAAIRRRGPAMFLWYGIALAFKLQAAFVAPFFVATAVAHRLPARAWFAAPAAYAAMLVPAWAAGWPLGSLLTIYLRQVDSWPALALNAPNIWMIVDAAAAPPLAAARAVATMATLAAVGCYMPWGARRLRDADAPTTLRLALFCALIVPGLLPPMHERYFFVADVLAIALAIVRPREWRLAVLTQLGSGLALLAYLTGLSALAVEGAVAMLAATWLAVRPLLSSSPAAMAQVASA